jgi:hypothetical protein
MNIYEKLSKIQNELKVPKTHDNKFGGYKFRNCEDILEAAKPICAKYKTVLWLSDSIEYIGNRYYVKATAILFDNEKKEEGPLQFIENHSYAREDEVKKGMDQSQITGASSSYARKYALNGLFNLDDSKDSDEISAEEIGEHDELGEATIDETKVQALKKAVENKGLTNLQLQNGLAYFGYGKIEDVKIKDYMRIHEAISKTKGEK